MSVEIICPVCHHSDQIEKVSAAYNSGISTGETKSWMPPPPGTDWAPLQKTDKVTLQTALSKRLSPPEEPNKSAIRREKVGSIGCYLVVGFIIGCLLILKMNIDGNQSGYLVSLFLYIGFALVLQFAWYSPKVKEADKLYEEKSIEYSSTICKWNKAYYCHRDDIVFLPGSEKWVRPESLHNL